MFGGAAAQIREQHQRLSELDCVAGDGDHGSTMLRVVEQLEHAAASGHTAPRELLRDAGWKVLGVDGGASSSLLGTLFAGMADVPGEGPALDCREVAAAFECGLAAIRRQTKAQPGDKTMMDALIPAVAALGAAAVGDSVLERLRRAAEAAHAGAETTRKLVAHYGRAKYQGEKTRGHLDPGAVSVALMFEGFYRGLAESKGETGNAGRG
jgi:phosphoenolpyruvate---glycerone phosphotransferase subunit DhaL